MKRAGIAVLLLLACHREAPPPAKKIVHVTTTNIPSDERKVKENDLIRKSARFLDSAKIGTALGPDGGVAEETLTFAERQPVYFTLQQYYRNARLWLTEFIRQQHRVPDAAEFDREALRWLQ